MSWEMVAARVEIQFINRRLTDNENENIRDHAATVAKRADASVRSEWKLRKKTPKMLLSFFSLVRLSLKPWSHLIKSLSIRRKIVHTWKTYEWSGHHHRFYAGSEGPASMCICRAEGGRGSGNVELGQQKKKSLNSEQWRRRQNWGGGKKIMWKNRFSLWITKNQFTTTYQFGFFFCIHNSPRFSGSRCTLRSFTSHGKINNAAW